jgi:hypothetical protein
MKKLIYIFLGLLIVACSSDDSGSTSGSNSNSFNPPTWIQGVWLNDIGNGTSSIGFDFRDDNVCSVTFGSAYCYKGLIELYADVPNINTSVYEEISASRYYFVFTYGPNEITGEFEKVSDNTINYFYSSDIPTILTKQ